MVICEPYRTEQADLWNAFVAQSRNGTFLFDRRYMEYHADRFEDHSVVIHRDDTVIALLPANRVGDVVHSHQGLSYGGLIIAEAMTAPLMLDAMAALFDHLRAAGARQLLYTSTPHIYHRYPAEEDRYAMFRLGAELVRRDILSVAAQDSRPAMQTRRRRGIKKARDAGLSTTESDDWTGFWRLLENTLDDRHGVRPVHTVDEIDFLRRIFPDNIRLFVCSGPSGLVAGTVIYESAQVARTQYIASSELGRTTGALDLLFATLLDDIFVSKPYFDFGSSHHGPERQLAGGLIDQKEGFGARSIVHDTYRFDLS